MSDAQQHRPKHHPQWVDWDRRREVISEVVARNGTAAEAGGILGISEETAWKSARRLGLSFSRKVGWNHMAASKLKPEPAPAPAPSKRKANAGQEQSRERIKGVWTAYRQRQRFAKALDAAPEQPLSDAELIEKALAEGKLTKVPAGSALVPMWLSGIHDNCVKPRPGASKGARA